METSCGCAYVKLYSYKQDCLLASLFNIIFKNQFILFFCFFKGARVEQIFKLFFSPFYIFVERTKTLRGGGVWKDFENYKLIFFFIQPLVYFAIIQIVLLMKRRQISEYFK